MDIKHLTSVLNVNYPAVLPLDVRGVRWAKLSAHSILGRQYRRNPDGSFTPEFVMPDPYDRKNDAESLVDGYVTLTFLDGDMSVATHRSQRYLDRGLLDRNYAPTPVARKPKPKPKPIVRPEPEPTPEPLPENPPSPPANEIVVEFQEAEAVKPIDESPVSITQSVPVIDKTAPPRSTAPVEPTPATAPEPEPAPEYKQQAVTPVSTAGPTKPRAAPEPEQQQEEPAKKKPDSWLRRIFDPDSWRR